MVDIEKINIIKYKRQIGDRHACLSFFVELIMQYQTVIYIQKYMYEKRREI